MCKTSQELLNTSCWYLPSSTCPILVETSSMLALNSCNKWIWYSIEYDNFRLSFSQTRKVREQRKIRIGGYTVEYSFMNSIQCCPVVLFRRQKKSWTVYSSFISLELSWRIPSATEREKEVKRVEKRHDILIYII